MEILKSKYHTQGWIKLRDIKYKIKQHPVDEIWASVPQADKHMGRPFYGPVMEDIKKNGLHFPLLVVKATRAQVVEQKNIWKDKLVELPFPHKQGLMNDEKTPKWWIDNPENNRIIQLVCWGGSQRLRVARELGYTHIDCAMIPKFTIAHKLQKVLRGPYGHLYKK